MRLYFSPLACSLSSRIALYEANLPAEFIEVDPKTKRTSDGRDYRTIHPVGLVPLLELDDGQLLSENAAILQFIAGVPEGSLERARLQEWLAFISTELHKTVFVPLLDAKAPPQAKDYAQSKAAARLEHVATRLEKSEYLLDRFTVADAYLYTVLNWAMVTPIDLDRYPSIRAYQKRIRARPSVDRAFKEERVLYANELARHAVSSVVDFATGR
jgi:glutathione S-transferase